MSEKTALVTGASRGIGRAIAVSLQEAGYKVAIHYRSGQAEAEALQKQLPGSQIYQADLAQPEECQKLIKAVKQDFGRIDALVNNAGMSIDQVITFAKPADFERLVDVNLKSVFHLTKLVTKTMIKQKSGRIINLSSVVGHTGNKGQSMYAATKGAITAFTKSVAQDLAPFGILVNCVAPGFIATEMTGALAPEVQEAILSQVPLQRLGQPHEVADAVSFLCSDKASYITGSTLHINGGMYTN